MAAYSTRPHGTRSSRRSIRGSADPSPRLRRAPAKRNRIGSETGRTVSVITLDIDHFEKVNDTYEHDAVLRRAADALREEPRDRGIAARLGGEEFAVILPEEVEAAQVLAEKLRARTERMVMQEIGCRVTVSSGIAASPLHAASPENLFKLVDDALQEAKASGRNRVCVSRKSSA